VLFKGEKMKKFKIDWDVIQALALSLSLPAALVFGALFPSLFANYR
jgi:hypothetical protein